MKLGDKEVGQDAQISICERLKEQALLPAMALQGRPQSRDFPRKFLGPPSQPSWWRRGAWGSQVFLCPPAEAEVA